MEILYLLIPLAMILLAIAIWGFIWAVRHGQFDDMEGPAHRILMDDDDPRIPTRNPEAKDESAHGLKDKRN
jgi:cbb3-type cytochrome oxidase maturation protein